MTFKHYYKSKRWGKSFFEDECKETWDTARRTDPVKAEAIDLLHLCLAEMDINSRTYKQVKQFFGAVPGTTASMAEFFGKRAYEKEQQ